MYLPNVLRPACRMEHIETKMERFEHWMRENERRVDALAEQFLATHRVLGTVAVLIGAPLAMMAAVSACTMAVILPLSWLWGF